MLCSTELSSAKKQEALLPALAVKLESRSLTPEKPYVFRQFLLLTGHHHFVFFSIERCFVLDLGEETGCTGFGKVSCLEVAMLWGFITFLYRKASVSM